MSNTLFFIRKKIYKNDENKLEQITIIRTNLEHFEVGKFKDKKIKMMNYISSKHVTKEWLECH